MSEEKNWEDIIAIIKNIQSSCYAYLSTETIDAVTHYVDSDEYEMAAEGLLIDVMELEQLPDDFKKEDCLKLARLCNLDKEIVFCPDFWEQLNAFCSVKHIAEIVAPN